MGYIVVVLSTWVGVAAFWLAYSAGATLSEKKEIRLVCASVGCLFVSYAAVIPFIRP